MTAAAAGAAAVSATSLAAAPAFAAPSAPLPGEVSRIANVVTASPGRKLYDNIEVNILGDRARIFLPQSVIKGATTAVGAVWFYHGGGSSHNALNGGFKYPGELIVDQGAIAICINAGGTQYSNTIAQQAQVNAWNWLKTSFNVRKNYLRATSAGGALGTYTYARKLIPYIRGLYMVNGLYDLEQLYARGNDEQYYVGLAFNNDPALIAASNPARLSAAFWAKSKVKVLVSDAEHPDTVVEPVPNGIALINKITPVALDAQLAYHTLGHDTPSWSNRDMITTFATW